MIEKLREPCTTDYFCDKATIAKQMRELYDSSLEQLQPEDAVFYAEKLCALNGYQFEDVYLLASACYHTREYERSFHFLKYYGLLEISEEEIKSSNEVTAFVEATCQTLPSSPSVDSSPTVSGLSSQIGRLRSQSGENVNTSEPPCSTSSSSFQVHTNLPFSTSLPDYKVNCAYKNDGRVVSMRDNHNFPSSKAPECHLKYFLLAAQCLVSLERWSDCVLLLERCMEGEGMRGLRVPMRPISRQKRAVATSIVKEQISCLNGSHVGNVTQKIDFEENGSMDGIHELLQASESSTWCSILGAAIRVSNAYRIIRETSGISGTGVAEREWRLLRACTHDGGFVPVEGSRLEANLVAQLCTIRARALTRLREPLRAAQWALAALRISPQSHAAMRILEENRLLSVTQEHSLSILLQSLLCETEPESISSVDAPCKEGETNSSVEWLYPLHAVRLWQHVGYSAPKRHALFSPLSALKSAPSLSLLSAEICLEKSDLSEANSVLSALVDGPEPHCPRAATALIAGLYIAGDTAALFARTHGWLSRAPAPPQLPLALGLYQLLRGAPTAPRLLTHAFAICSSSGSPAGGTGTSSTADGGAGKAAGAPILQNEFYGLPLAALGYLCVAAERQRDLEGAQTAARELFVRTPGSPFAASVLAGILARSDQLAPAEEFARLALRRDPECAPALHELGSILYIRRNFSPAAEVIVRLLTVLAPAPLPLRARFAGSLLLLGHAARRSGALAASIAAYEEALAFLPASNGAPWAGSGGPSGGAGASANGVGGNHLQSLEMRGVALAGMGVSLLLAQRPARAVEHLQKAWGLTRDPAVGQLLRLALDTLAAVGISGLVPDDQEDVGDDDLAASEGLGRPVSQDAGFRFAAGSSNSNEEEAEEQDEEEGEEEELQDQSLEFYDSLLVDEDEDEDEDEVGETLAQDDEMTPIRSEGSETPRYTVCSVEGDTPVTLSTQTQGNNHAHEGSTDSDSGEERRPEDSVRPRRRHITVSDTPEIARGRLIRRTRSARRQRFSSDSDGNNGFHFNNTRGSLSFDSPASAEGEIAEGEEFVDFDDSRDSDGNQRIRASEGDRDGFDTMDETRRSLFMDEVSGSRSVNELISEIYRRRGDDSDEDMDLDRELAALIQAEEIELAQRSAGILDNSDI